MAVEETRQGSSSAFFSRTLQQTTATARALNPEALGARTRELSTPQGRFCEGYRKMPYESRKTSENVQRNDVQALGQRKWRLFTLMNSISRRKLNLTILNAFPGNFVLNCRWDRVATTYITRDIDCQSSRTFLRLSTVRYDDFFRMMNV